MKFMRISFALFPVSFASVDDPCMRLCEAFSARGLGNGFDLCEGGTSECLPSSMTETCSDLFWASFENGGRGLIYGADVVDHEHVGRVTCLEAAQTAGGIINQFFTAGFALVSNLAPFNRSSTALVRDLTSSFRSEIASGNPFRYSTVKRLFDSHDCIHQPDMDDMLIDLLAAYNMSMNAATSRSRRCTDCGNLFVNDYSERIFLEARENATLIDLMISEFRSTWSGQWFCPDCHHQVDVFGMNRLRNPLGDVLVIRVNRLEGAVVSIPSELDLSNIVSPHSLSDDHRYRLVARTNLMDPSYADILISDQWYRVNETHSEQVEFDSGVFKTLIYQRF